MKLCKSNNWKKWGKAFLQYLKYISYQQSYTVSIVLHLLLCSTELVSGSASLPSCCSPLCSYSWN